MIIVISSVVALILDLILGDPAWMPHPVKLMGKYISRAEKKYLTETGYADGTGSGRSIERESRGGLLLAVSLPVLTFLIAGVVITVLWMISPVLGFIVNTFLCYQAIAVKDMKKESMNVYYALTGKNDKNGDPDLRKARRAVSRIVGRDTGELSEEGVIKATVESVAESFSDGITAPLFFMLIGGAPLALCYKAINTMDSMIGYKNDKYMYFGKAAARLDDIANFIPSRLAALFLIIGARISNLDVRNAVRIWKRDRRNHESPNSAQTESVMAGALGIRLGGPASYFGQLKDKPYIGDPTFKINPEDIISANQMMYDGTAVAIIIMGVIRAVLWLLV